MTPPTPPVTVLRDGRYELQEPLGHGGMASVFLAFDHELGAYRALKLVRFKTGTQKSRRRRLRAEARAMARLRHPHIVQVFDIGFEGALDYIVMELVPGGTLSDRLDQAGSVPIHTAVGWMLDVLSALSEAHAAGIVHRDVKPHNVLLDGMDRAMLADFGIAMIEDDEHRRTRTGTAMGSMAYMPPEQRLDAARVSHHADLYAAGATLYELLTGMTAIDLFLADPTSPRWEGIPGGLADVIRRACAEKPADRYPSAVAFAEALAPWGDASERPFARAPVSTLPPPPPPLATGTSYVPTQGATTPTLVDMTRLATRRVTPATAGLLVAVVVLAATMAWVVMPGATSLTRPASEGAPVEPAVAPAIAVGGATEAQEAEASEHATVASPVSAAPMVSRSRPAAASLPAPLGTWSMNQNGVVVELVLRGQPDAIVGEVRSTLSRKQVVRSLTGTYTASSRRLALAEDDGDVRYVVDLSEDLATGRGTLDVSGRIETVTLERTNP